MKRKIVVCAIGFFVFIVVFLLMFICAHVIAGYLDIFPMLPHFSYRYGKPFIALFLVAFSAYIAIRCSYFAMRLYWKTSPILEPVSKRLAIMLLICYIATAVIGVPAAQDQNMQWVIEEHERIDQDDKFKMPYSQTYLALPVLPFVIVSYHEYQIASVYGEGLWYIQIWYLFGIKRMIFLPVWIS